MSTRVVNEGGVNVQEESEVLDCEIRDWERLGALPLSMQDSILEAIQSGKVPKSLLPLIRRLRDAGIVVCT